MLREILLSLSGVPSSIWQDLKSEQPADHKDEPSLDLYVSRPERELINVLAELVDLHLKLRESTTTITLNHPSPIYRAISNRIKSKHLRDFTDKTIEVEKSILQEDAKYVAAYKTVPLSTIVTEFRPWARPLRWMWKIIQEMQVHDLTTSCKNGSASSILTLLDAERRTGYLDIEGLSTDLLIAAQRAWMQSLMSWVLYGQIPHFGANDFMVQIASTVDSSKYSLKHELIPYFVTSEAANNILSIGQTLNQIRSGGVLSQGTVTSTSVCNTQVLTSYEQIQTLEYPLQSNNFADVVEVINTSISQAALSHILPVDMIFEFLLVVQDYALLGNGEFSATLIQQADAVVQRHQAGMNTARPVRKLGRLDDMSINHADAATALSKTWSELSAVVPENEDEDLRREKASLWLGLRSSSTNPPVSTMLPISTYLTIQLPAESPLNIFISTSDIKKYRDISCYLLSIHRAEAQLEKLWKMSSHRRCHNRGPPLGTTSRGQQALTKRKAREARRNSRMRAHWACASRVLFLLSETINYFHGEVITKSWESLQAWLDIDRGSRPTSSGITSRPTTASSKWTPSHLSHSNSSKLRHSFGTASRENDPRAIAQAHRQYLTALYSSLLVDNSTFVAIVQELLTTVDHFVALFQRLSFVWQSVDLEEDGGMVSAMADYAQEEEDIMVEMKRTKDSLSDQIHELVDTIREAETARDLTDVTTGIVRMGVANDRRDDFVPWRARTLDLLLMKLDFLAAEGSRDKFEDALVDAEDA